MTTSRRRSLHETAQTTDAHARDGSPPELSRFVHREREADRDGLVQRHGGRRESSVPGPGVSRGQAGLVSEDNGLPDTSGDAPLTGLP